MRTLQRLGARALQCRGMGLEVALDGEHADGRHAHQPRFWSGSIEISSPGMGSSSSREAAATRSGSSKWVVASTIARARRPGRKT